MENNNSNKTKKITPKTVKQKAIIVGLSVALGLSGVTAIVAPTMVAALKKGGHSGDVTTFTVTFDTMGGSTVQPQKVVQGEHAVRPVDPSKDDASFAGWYTDDSYSKLFILKIHLFDQILKLLLNEDNQYIVLLQLHVTPMDMVHSLTEVLLLLYLLKKAKHLKKLLNQALL